MPAHRRKSNGNAAASCGTEQWTFLFSQSETTFLTTGQKCSQSRWQFALVTSICMKTQAERALDYRAKWVHLPSSLGESCLPEVFVVTISNSVEWSDVKSLSCVQLFAIPWTVAYQASPMGFSRQEYWSGLPFPSPEDLPHPGIELGSPAM